MKNNPDLLTQFKRIAQINAQIKANEQEMRSLQVPIRRPDTGSPFRAAITRLLVPKNKEAEKRIAFLWNQQAALAKEFAAFPKETMDAFVDWSRKQQNADVPKEMSPQENEIDQDDIIDKFRRECQLRRLQKGKRIPSPILYEIAKTVGIPRVPRGMGSFRPGTPAYAEARQYASLTRYAKRRQRK